MFTRLRLLPFTGSGNWERDAPRVVKWISDYFLSLEQKGALEADYSPPTTWTPVDGSGAGLVLTVASAKVTKIGSLVTLQADITYPVTASGAAAKITAPYSASVIHTGSFWTAGAGGGTASDITGTAVQFLIQAGGNVTNANLSNSRVIFTITYQV